MPALGRIAFLGTGAFGRPLLEALVDLADEILVVSQPDRPAGRGLRTRPSPIAGVARERGLALATPARLRSDEGRSALRGFGPHGLVLAAYGQIVPADILALGERPPLNVHSSLLPRHRGAAPVAGAILAGDTETGVTLIEMTPQLDAGPIVAQWRVPLTGREQAPELEERLARLAAVEVPVVLERWSRGGVTGREQDHYAATYTRPLTREDGRIEWRRTADEIDRQVRALQPWPGAWTMLDGRRLHVRSGLPREGSSGATPGSVLAGPAPAVACGHGALELGVVQPEGRAPMPADAWLRGVQHRPVVLGG